MYYHCSDDGYIVSTTTQCKREVPFVIPLPERNFIITSINLSSNELIDWIRRNDARMIAISAIEDAIKDVEGL